ncbi:hypothetical protein [Roseateles sp. SL47]|uniref:hypothetical protein n=1 Tax=Roseateles sp. SL47 TaxID=2995138 RepID=UPI003B6368F5
MLQDVRSAAEDYKPSTSRTLEIQLRDARAGDGDSDISTEQKPLGHADLATTTTMIYTHVLSIGRRAVRSTWTLRPALRRRKTGASEIPLPA